MSKQDFKTCDIPSKWPRKMRKFFGPGCIITISICRNSGKVSTLSSTVSVTWLKIGCVNTLLDCEVGKIKEKEDKKKAVEEGGEGGDVRVTQQEKKLFWLTPCIMFTFNKRSNQNRIKCFNFETWLHIRELLNPVTIFLSFPSPRWFASDHTLDLLHEDLWAYF